LALFVMLLFYDWPFCMSVLCKKAYYISL